ncbi:MAG: hypothetical protein WAN48_09405 [Actinomycetes bacterium]
MVITDDSEGTTYRVVDPDVGTTVTLSASYLVEPSAPFATTLESVGSPFPAKGDRQLVGFVDDVQVTMARGLSSVDYQPFSPQRVAPGETISLRVTFTIPDCPRDEPGQRIEDTVPVTYRSFGVTHTERLPLGYSVAIQNGVACRTWTG